MAKANKVDSPELLALKAEADELGVKYGATVGEAGLQKKIDEFKASQNTGDEDNTSTGEDEGSTDSDNDSGDDNQPKDEKPALKPLNDSANVKPAEKKVEWTGKPKQCDGNKSFYEDTEENFPILRTPRGDKNTYSKDFLDKKVKSGSMEENDGIYTPVTK